MIIIFIHHIMVAATQQKSNKKKKQKDTVNTMNCSYNLQHYILPRPDRVVMVLQS